MNRHIFFRIVSGLILLAAIAGIAFFAFNAGMTRGAAVNLSLTTPQDGVPVPYGYGMPFYRPHFFGPMFGLGCFGVLIPLFLVFLAFGALRRMMWGPRRFMHGHGPMGGPWGGHMTGGPGCGPEGRGGHGVPPMFSEWHRRAHEQPSAAQPGETPADPASQA